MVIDGVSQSVGLERLVEVAADPAGGVRVVIRDPARRAELAAVTVPSDGLMTILADQPAGARSLPGAGGKALGVEVRRNEVLLAIGGPDAAVGLDDLTDAVAAAVPG